jgi:hypothetical protein
MTRPQVVISPNLIKTSERIDMNGNVIDPRTKQIIRKADEPVKKEEPKQE